MGYLKELRSVEESNALAGNKFQNVESFEVCLRGRTSGEIIQRSSFE